MNDSYSCRTAVGSRIGAALPGARATGGVTVGDAPGVLEATGEWCILGLFDVELGSDTGAPEVGIPLADDEGDMLAAGGIVGAISDEPTE